MVAFLRSIQKTYLVICHSCNSFLIIYLMLLFTQLNLTLSSIRHDLAMIHIFIQLCELFSSGVICCFSSIFYMYCIYVASQFAINQLSLFNFYSASWIVYKIRHYLLIYKFIQLAELYKSIAKRKFPHLDQCFFKIFSAE